MNFVFLFPFAIRNNIYVLKQVLIGVADAVKHGDIVHVVESFQTFPEGLGLISYRNRESRAYY